MLRRALLVWGANRRLNGQSNSELKQNDDRTNRPFLFFDDGHAVCVAALALL